MRVKRGVAARAKHKKILKAAEGMQHNRTRSFVLQTKVLLELYSTPTAIVENKKRDLRGLWITRINAAARQEAQLTGKLIASMKSKNMRLIEKY